MIRTGGILRVGLMALAIVVGGATDALRAASGFGEWVAKGWKIRIDEREETTGRKTGAVRLIGEEAREGSDGLVRVTNLRLESHSPEVDGASLTNLIIEAPTSVWDKEKETARSADTITAWTPDGRFRIEGKGFLWTRASGLLVVTNGVRTSLMAEESLSPADGAEGKPIEIRAWELHLGMSGDRRFARYRRMVEAIDPSGVNLKSFELRVDFEENEEGRNELAEVVAEGNVLIAGVMEGRSFEAVGDSATYRVSPRSIVMPDGPVIRSEGNLLSGRRALINLEEEGNLILTIDDDVRMETVAAPEERTGDGKEPQAKPTVIRAGALRFEQKDGVALFERNVRVAGADGMSLRSGRLQAELDADTSKLGGIEAAENVVIEMETEQGRVSARAAAATIHQADKRVALRREGGAQPEVVQGRNILRGDELELDASNPEDIRFKAVGDTFLKAIDFGGNLKSPVELRSDRFSYGRQILLAEGGAKLAFVVPENEKAKARPMRAEAKSVIVDQKLGTVTLDGAVRVRDEQGLKVSCDHLVTDLPDPERPEERLSDMTAQGNVTVELEREGRLYRATGDKAVYSAERDELELTGGGHIESGPHRVFGDRILASIADPEATVVRAVGRARMEGVVESRDGPRKITAGAEEISVDQKAGLAKLRRKVRIIDDTGVDIQCDELDAGLPDGDAKVALSPDKRSVTGIPDFIARKNVVARMRHELGDYDVWCDEAEYQADTDTLELRGNLKGLSPEGVIRGSVFRYSLKTRKGAGQARMEIDVNKALEKYRKSRKKKTE